MTNQQTIPQLILIVPVYNEEQVLPVTSKEFLAKLRQLIADKKVAATSQIWYINDGSQDKSWQLINELAAANKEIVGFNLSRNYGHQSAILAGLTQAQALHGVTITLDCDGQDDIDVINDMLAQYARGYQIVYGVRDDRQTDTWFKRATAESFYKLLHFLGVEVVYNHADYRLLSTEVLRHLSDFGEVNLYLRGLIPLLGFPSTTVPYKRHARVAGQSHYPLHKMLHLALDGITSLSVKPVRMITWLGFMIALLSFIGVLWSVIVYFQGHSIIGWASMTSIICFIGGIQLVSIGIIGEYIGKIYLETKKRPRFIIQEIVGNTQQPEGKNDKK